MYNEKKWENGVFISDGYSFTLGVIGVVGPTRPRDSLARRPPPVTFDVEW